MGDIRKPIKQSAIEKKQRIIEKGFELMCEKGYHNINSVDIARYASVSTGIIYQYFNDKRDIFLAGVKNYSNSIMFPMIELIQDKKINTNNIEQIINDLIDKFIETHKISYKAHEELMSQCHLDNEVKEVFKQRELELTKKIVKALEYNNYKIQNVTEKVHIIIGLVDNFCHEVVYHNHKDMNYNIMKNEIIKAIIFILNN